MNNESRETVRDYLNDELKETELMNKFDLKKCPVCGSYELEEDMVSHKWDNGDIEDKICPSCREDE